VISQKNQATDSFISLVSQHFRGSDIYSYSIYKQMRLIFDKLGITGFRSDSITPISCIAYSNEKAWILTVNPRFLIHRFKCTMVPFKIFDSDNCVIKSKSL